MLYTRATQSVSAVFAVERWLDGWMSVTRQYCVWTAKPILKVFQPSGSPIIPVFSDPSVDTQFQGEPASGGGKYTGVGKSCNFLQKSPSVSETVRDRTIVTMER